jgi:hypothetical protein
VIARALVRDGLHRPDDAAHPLDALERSPRGFGGLALEEGDVGLLLLGGQALAELPGGAVPCGAELPCGSGREEGPLAVVSLVHRFLTKPCPPEELLHVVERVLRVRHRLDGENVRASISGIGLLPRSPSTLPVARHAERPETPSPNRSNLAAVVQLAHALVESERACVCGRPGHPALADGFLEAAGVLDEVRAWRDTAEATVTL